MRWRRPLAALGGETVLISGPVALAPPDGVKLVKVETAQEMLAAVEAALPVDIAVFAAAVADWRVEGAQAQKITKVASGAAPHLALVENPDILKHVAAMTAGRPRLVVGFAAETDERPRQCEGEACAQGLRHDHRQRCEPGERRHGRRGEPRSGGDRAGRRQLARHAQARGGGAAHGAAGGEAGGQAVTLLTVPFVRLPHAADLAAPAYATAGAAGLDLRAALGEGEVLVLAPGERAAVPTGIALALPEGY